MSGQMTCVFKATLHDTAPYRCAMAARTSGCRIQAQLTSENERRVTPGHALHLRPAHADQHLGEVPEAEAHQRRRAGEHPIPLLLEAAQPAGRRGGGAQRPAAKGAAVPAVRAGDAGTLQFPLRLLPEAEE